MSIENVKMLIRLAAQEKVETDRNALLSLALTELAKVEEKNSDQPLRFPIEIFKRYKGQTYYAHLLEGWKVGYQGNVFSSPSAAAVSISGHNENGWRMWRYNDTETKKEYPIDKLRTGR